MAFVLAAGAYDCSQCNRETEGNHSLLHDSSFAFTVTNGFIGCARQTSKMDEIAWNWGRQALSDKNIDSNNNQNVSFQSAFV